MAALEPRQIWDGVVVRRLHGERISSWILEFESMTQVAEHRHDNEQLDSSGPDGATVLDVFSPARSDWNGTPLMAVAEGRWP